MIRGRAIIPNTWIRAIDIVWIVVAASIASPTADVLIVLIVLVYIFVIAIAVVLQLRW